MTHVFQLLLAISLFVISSNAIYAQGPRLFNTGVNADGIVTGVDRDVDIHYTVRLPNQSSESPTYIYRRAFNDNPTYTPWLRNSTSSAWISAIKPEIIEMSGGYFAKADGPVGDYFYTLTFDMTGFNPNTLQMSGRWAADDAAVFMYLNGQQIVNVGQGVPAFNRWMPFWVCQPGQAVCGPSSDIVPGDGTFDAAHLLPGINKLTFQVHNLAGPTGLRVEISATDLVRLRSRSRVPPTVISAIVLAVVAVISGLLIAVWRKHQTR